MHCIEQFSDLTLPRRRRRGDTVSTLGSTPDALATSAPDRG